MKITRSIDFLQFEESNNFYLNKYVIPSNCYILRRNPANSTYYLMDDKMIDVKIKFTNRPRAIKLK